MLQGIFWTLDFQYADFPVIFMIEYLADETRFGYSARCFRENDHLIPLRGIFLDAEDARKRKARQATCQVKLIPRCCRRVAGG